MAEDEENETPNQNDFPITPEEIELKKAEGWLTRKELAALHEVSMRAVIKWEELGYLTPHKFDGRTIYYDPKETAALPQKVRRRGRPATIEKEMSEMVDDIDSLGDSEEDPEDETPAPAMGVKQALGHFAMAPAQIIKHVTGAMRQSQLALHGMMSSINSLMSSLIDRSNEENERLRTRINLLEDKNWKMLENFEAIMNSQHERAVRERAARERTEIIREAASKFTDLAPLLMSFLGDKFDPSNPALKEATLTHIVGKLDENQLEALMKTGAFDPVDMTAILSIRERLIKQEEERLKRKAEEMEKEENVA